MRKRLTLDTWRLLGASMMVGNLQQAGLGLACRVLVLVLVWALGGCARLPVAREAVASTALLDLQHTRLAQIAKASDPQPEAGRSGFRLLPSGAQALDARLSLVQHAERTLDLQYYQVAHDATGLQLLRALRDAGRRGVRVRLLVDDLYAAGQDRLLAGLAAQPNVQVRLFNPLPVRQAGFKARVALSLHEFSRINRRMHNKLFVADNSVSVSGGRNIADEYFDRSEPANFIDMDVLATGPVVPQQAEVFDRFWNSPQAWPVTQLLNGQHDPAALRAAFDIQVQGLPQPDPTPGIDSFGQSAVGDELRAGRLRLHTGTARLLADAPAKADADADAAETEGEVATAHRALLHSARDEVLLTSPYLVPGLSELSAWQDASQRQVRLSMITNSLTTTDEPLVHAGYARYRAALLKMGVRLYELMPSITGAAERRPGERPSIAGSLGRLHAKMAVVDRRWLYIGSMNMDRRSALTNTEAGLIIDSPDLCEQARALLVGERIPGSYQLQMRNADGDGEGIVWVERDGAKEVTHLGEPHTSGWQSVRLWLTLKVVGESML